MTATFRFVLLSSLLLLLPFQIQADIPASLEFDGNKLTLNGEGIRKKYMMSIYKGGLYLSKPDSDAAAIVAADEPMAIRIDMVSGMITSDKMVEALMEGLEDSTGGNIAPLQEYVDQFIAVFQEKIKEGDYFDLAYIPGKGLEIYKLGALKASIDGGMVFKQAIFGIWLGDKPADSKLKKGMLG